MYMVIGARKPKSCKICSETYQTIPKTKDPLEDLTADP